MRLFASALSGCGHITYWKFLACDLIGTVLYASAWVTVGYLVGDRAAEFLEQHRASRLLVVLAPAGLAALLAYRVWRRRRYGPASAAAVVVESACVQEPAERG